MQKKCCICGKGILQKLAKSKNYRKIGDHFHFPGKYRSAPNSICKLKFNFPNEVHVVFHNG